MVNTQYLRRNNLLLDLRSNTIEKVRCFGIETLTLDKEDGLIGVSDASPVLITETLLRRFGFKVDYNFVSLGYKIEISDKNESVHRFILCRYIIRYSTEWIVFKETEKYNYCKLTIIQHIHQIQNIVHSITGQELTFK